MRNVRIVVSALVLAAVAGTAWAAGANSSSHGTPLTAAQTTQTKDKALHRKATQTLAKKKGATHATIPTTPHDGH